jgi:ATP-dependent Clp protease protease subunit
MKVLMTAFLGTLLVLGFSFTAQSEEIVLTSKNTVVMNESFNGSSVARVQNRLLNLSIKSGQDLYLFLYSPGGSITAGKQLIAFTKSLPNKVHTITQFAASMAYITAQHLDKRYILPSGTMMSHRASIGGLGGQVPGEANTRLGYIQSIVDEIFTSTASRVGMSHKNYVQLVYDELWLTADKAVEGNHADAVINARCDDSLKGVRYQTVRTLFGNFRVSFSRCPLITGPVSIDTDNIIFRNHILNKLDLTQQNEFTLLL